MSKRPSSKTLEQRLRELEKELVDCRQKETALRESEKRWRSVLEKLPNYILILDTQGKILYTNGVMPGLTMDAIIGMNAFQFIPVAHRDKLRQAMENARQTGEPDTYEIRTNEIPVVIQGEKTEWWSNRIRAGEGMGQVQVIGFQEIQGQVRQKEQPDPALGQAPGLLELGQEQGQVGPGDFALIEFALGDGGGGQVQTLGAGKLGRQGPVMALDVGGRIEDGVLDLEDIGPQLVGQGRHLVQGGQHSILR